MIRFHTPLAVSDQPVLKDWVDVCSVAGELGESGASHNVADRGGGRDGVVLDDLLLGARWDRACRRTALGTWAGREGQRQHTFNDLTFTWLQEPGPWKNSSALMTIKPTPGENSAILRFIKLVLGCLNALFAPAEIKIAVQCTASQKI